MKYGMIGCGMMGREHLRNLTLLGDAEVLAIVEPDAAMRDAARALAPAARFPSTIEALLAIDALECLVIASPNHLHAAQLVEIRARRPLPVLVEKPLFTDPADAAALRACLTSWPAPVWVAMEYRYMPPLAAFIARAGEVTGGVDLLSIREHRFPFLEKVGNWNRFNRHSGGTFVEKCCHYFDLMRLVLNAEPVSVMASAGQAHNHVDERYAGETPDIWDNGYVLVSFDNGARAMLELCMFAEGAEFQEELSAVGVAGKIECRIPGPGRFRPAHLGPEPAPRLVVSPRVPRGPVEIEIPIDPALLAAGDHHGSTYFQHVKFRDVVLGGGTPEVTIDDGWRAVLMGMAAQASARSGEACRIDTLRNLAYVTL